ncbi:hypothetical protein [Mucilaginibacter sp. L196]|uniref:hypothetical protein n=1 Tax=Mucilaginibacter sp. L196 TaxID=1641870 RepID=UPI00131C9238|nr:hypothetical protein [Mucilaginibacter sp. L196]
MRIAAPIPILDLQQQPLSPQADLLRALINAAENPEQLAEKETYLTRHILAQSLDLHELEVLSYLIGKRYNEFRLTEIQDRNEGNRKIGR